MILMRTNLSKLQNKTALSEQDNMSTKLTTIFFFSHSTIRATTEDLLEQTFIAILAFVINEIKLFLSLIYI